MQTAQASTLTATSMNPAEACAELMELCRSIRNERPREISSARKVTRSPGRQRPVRRGLASRILSTHTSAPTFKELWFWIVALVPTKVKQSPAVRLVHLYPGLTAWFLVFASTGFFITGQGSMTPHPHHTSKLC